MKKTIMIFAMLALMLTAAACGSAELPTESTAQPATQAPAQTLPERTTEAETSAGTDISSDVRILPQVLHCDDSAVGQETVPGPDAGDYSRYQPEMFYGRWRAEDDGKYKDHSVTKGMMNDTLVKYDGTEVSPEVLPWYFGFGIFNEGPYYKGLPLHLDTVTSGYCTFGTGVPTPGSQEVVMMVYDVSGDTLAIGFVDTARDDVRAGNYSDINVIKEVRYKIVEWTDCRLTLQYGDYQVTYIPDENLKQTNGNYELNWKRRMYLSGTCEVQDRLLEIGNDSKSAFTFDFGSDYYIPGGITLNADGTATLALEDGGQPRYGLNEYRDPLGTIQAGQDGKVCVVQKDGTRIWLADAMEWTYEKFYYSQSAITLVRNGIRQVFLTAADWGNEHLAWDLSAEMVLLDPEVITPTVDDDVRILPKVLHCDDSLIGQMTVPGPESGDYSLYHPEMFYGCWRVEDEGKLKDRSVTQGAMEETWLSVDGTGFSPEVLPWYMGFGIYKDSSQYRTLPLYFDTASTGYCTYGTGAPSDAQNTVMMVYDVSGDTLAIGLVDVARDKVLEGKYADVKVIKEMRYKIVEWTGCRLTLQYGDRQATYVPDISLKQTNGAYELEWGGGKRLSKESRPEGNPYLIGKDGVVFNNGLREDWKVPAAMTLNADGTARLALAEGQDMWLDYSYYGAVRTCRDGKVCACIAEGTYGYSDEAARLYLTDRMNWDFEAFYYSENAVTLRINGKNLIYLTKTDWDNNHLVWDYDAEKIWLPAETENLEGTSVMVGGEKLEEDLGYTVGELMDLGFATEADVTVPVDSRVVCEIFQMTKAGVTFDVRAVNPYGQQIPLIDCIVCYFGFDDATGLITLDGTIGCGTSTRKDVASLYRNPLIDKEDHLVYQTANPERDYGNKYGAFVISEDVSTADVLFRFDESGTLKQIVFLAPYLLYNTLENNLNEVDLGAQDPDELDEVLRVRDEILAQLQAAFEREGIQVDIDPLTGRITLDNRILFGYDRYDLTDEGKAYIDGFLKVYAEVLLAGDHADMVKGVQFDGHTDTHGPYEYNQKLSEKRADTVLQYCIGENKAGLTAEQTAAFAATATAVGHSFDQPIIGPDGKVDMEKSRRVEINFFLKLGE